MVWPKQRIDSRTRIPLFIAATTSVNEKQPFRRIFVKKLSVRSVSVTYGKTKRRDIAAAAGFLVVGRSQSAALINRNELKILWPDVVRRRTDQFVVDALFHHMCSPT